MTLVSDSEAEALHSAIVRKEAWTLDSVRRLRADAERHMKEGPWSVTTERPQGIAMDIHEFYSEAPYWWPQDGDPKAPYVRRDGQTNPNRFVANKNALTAMSDAVFTLGTAAYLLDDPRYAQRAARDIHTWFINPKSRMTPTWSIPRPSAISIMDAALASSMAAYSSAPSRGWNSSPKPASGTPKTRPSSRSGFRIPHLAHHQRQRRQREARRQQSRHLVDRPGRRHRHLRRRRRQQKAAFNYYRDHIFPRQIKSDGSAPREETRTRSLWYSAFNLEALPPSAASPNSGRRPVDRARQRRRDIATVIEYLEPYLTDPKKWTKEQITDFSNEGIHFLAYAGMGMKKPEYITLFRKLQHPEGAWLASPTSSSAATRPPATRPAISQPIFESPKCVLCASCVSALKCPVQLEMEETLYYPVQHSGRLQPLHRELGSPGVDDRGGHRGRLEARQGTYPEARPASSPTTGPP